MTPSKYIALDGRAAPLRLEGLEVTPEGALQLARLPGHPEKLQVEFADALTGPAGIAVDDDGTLYVADAGNHRILRIDCDGRGRPLPCLVGPGSEIGRVNAPRGLLVGPRRALYIADTGNHRIQVVDLETQQVRDIWGPPDPYGPPAPGAEPGQFDEPWDIAADASCRLYVVDHGNRRVQQLEADGSPVPEFWETMSKYPPQDPTHVAIAVLDKAERLLILDRVKEGVSRGRVLVYRTDGTLDADRSEWWLGELAGRVAGSVEGMAACGDVVYVGDPYGDRVLAFDVAGRYRGAVPAVSRPTGLAIDARGRLIMHPGRAGAPLLRLQAAAAFAESGRFVLGPIPIADAREAQIRLRAVVASLPDGANLRLFTLACRESEPEPSFPEDGTAGWHTGPANVSELLVAKRDRPYLWLGGRLASDGKETPVLRALALEEAESWLRYLPAVYARNDEGRELLERVLALFESVLGDERALIDALPRLYDPHSTPDEGGYRSWLTWLAGWLAFDIEEGWPEKRRRYAVGEAFRLHGRRGTVGGLRELARLHVDAPIFINEPARSASLWTLGGDGSTLGLTTMLVPAEADGAVVGTTAIVDRSHVITGEEHGKPLFSDLAHRFCVLAYAPDLARPGTDAALRSLLDREKPAHTLYHLCPIEPRFRVGFQSTIGVDSVIGAGPGSPEAGAGELLGVDLVLAAPAQDAGGRVGEARIGRETTLT